MKIISSKRKLAWLVGEKPLSDSSLEVPGLYHSVYYNDHPVGISTIVMCLTMIISLC